MGEAQYQLKDLRVRLTRLEDLLGRKNRAQADQVDGEARTSSAEAPRPPETAPHPTPPRSANTREQAAFRVIRDARDRLLKILVREKTRVTKTEAEAITAIVDDLSEEVTSLGISNTNLRGQLKAHTERPTTYAEAARLGPQP